MLAVRVRPPPVPVTGTVAGPVVDVLDALKVTVLLLPVVDPGLKVAVTPAGNPVALKTTLPVKLVRVMLIALVAKAPRATDTVAGFAAMVKFCAGFTVKLMTVFAETLPLVPVTITVVNPSVAVADAVKVTVVLLLVVDPGLKAALTPEGNPLAVKVMLPGNPNRMMLMTLVAVAPSVTDTLLGLGASVNGGSETTTFSVTVVVRVRPPPTPVIVTCVAGNTALAATVKVTVLLLPVADTGLNGAGTPLGKPLALSVIGPVKFVRERLIVEAAVLPWPTERLPGAAARAKLGGGGGALPGNSCVCGTICFAIPSGVLQESVAEASPAFS